MTDSTNNKELVAAGHQFARHMSSDTPIIDIAKMVTRLASQLDVTTVALRQANAELKSQKLELKASVAAEIEWEKTMMQAVGEDGIADVVSAIEKLKADGAALAAENAAMKTKGREVLKESAYVYSHYNQMVDHLDGESVDGQTLHESQCVIEDETPATDAFIAYQQAIGIKKAAHSGLFSNWVNQSLISFSSVVRNGDENDQLSDEVKS